MLRSEFGAAIVGGGLGIFKYEGDLWSGCGGGRSMEFVDCSSIDVRKGMGWCEGVRLVLRSVSGIPCQWTAMEYQKDGYERAGVALPHHCTLWNWPALWAGRLSWYLSRILGVAGCWSWLVAEVTIWCFGLIEWFPSIRCLVRKVNKLEKSLVSFLRFFREGLGWSAELHPLSSPTPLLVFSSTFASMGSIRGAQSSSLITA